MQLSDFDFDLPQDRIATRPARPRSSARLLVAEGDAVTDAHVFDLPDWLRPGDRLVLNDTRVIPARLSGSRRREGAQGPTEARIGVPLLEPQADGTWSALIKPLKKVADGEVTRFSDALSAVMEARAEGQGLLRFNLEGEDFDAALAEAGVEVLYDDRVGKVSPGVKFKDAELIGVPTIVVVGRGLAETGEVSKPIGVTETL